MSEPEDVTLAEAFWAVASRLRHQAAATAAPHGVTPAQARALGILQRHGPMRLSNLSDHLRIAARSVTEVVDALEALDLVARSPDPHDRRATLVAPTIAGTRVGEALRAARAADTEAFFGRLPDADRRTLARILGALRADDIPTTEESGDRRPSDG